VQVSISICYGTLQVQGNNNSVINMLPRMKPGIQRGKPVIVPYSLPITFVIADDISPSPPPK